MKRSKFYAGQIYHVCNKSIANFGIFKDSTNANRFFRILDYYNNQNITMSFSDFIKRKGHIDTFQSPLYLKELMLVKFLAYCIMPDHYHILIKPLLNHVVSKYINNIQNSFTRYFNIKFKRKGPLWQSRFRAIRVTSGEQLLHVTRYIHLNPTTANLVHKPDEWKFSSYNDYINDVKMLKQTLTELSSKNPQSYKKFCEHRINYQRKLKQIKKLLLE